MLKKLLSKCYFIFNFLILLQYHSSVLQLYYIIYYIKRNVCLFERFFKENY